MFLHVINHKTYHRGWVSEMFFDVGATPPETDLSVFLTERQRAYEPLRHPRAPGLSLAGVRLVIADRRRSDWAYCRSLHPALSALPRKGCRVGLRIVLFEACSAFNRVTAYTLALSPYFVTRFPKASAISSPPQLLRLLPAGAVAGWDLHPLESAALSRRTPEAVIDLR
jgi:hypothetical protein